MADLFSLEHLAFAAVGAAVAILMAALQRPARIDRRRDVHTLQLHKRRRPTVRVAPRAGRRRR